MTRDEKKQPEWWTPQHSSAWERVKAAFRRDWEQTKADLSKTKGEDLNQSAGDTVKQALGQEPIPPPHQPKTPEGPEEWTTVEYAFRYGYGSRQRHGTPWNQELEQSLERDWQVLDSGMSWGDAKKFVRRGFERDFRPESDGGGDSAEVSPPETRPRQPPQGDSSTYHHR